jgi:tryptophanyl-tRNA synthetase
MAADILLYDADIVPVGQDQTQHLELTRDLAERFNSRYGETFVIPQGYKAKAGAKIMSLIDPTKKMSKSDENPKAYISLLDDINVIRNKIKGAVTDLDTTVKYDPENKPGISNLLTIYQVITGKEMSEVEKEFAECNYQQFKEKVAEVVISEIKPIQERYNAYLTSPELDEILNEGRDAALKVGYKKIAKVYQKIGLGRKQK